MQGYLRRKTRAQAQQEIPFQQRAFGGGQNSDLVATKIAGNEVALSVNTVHTASDIQGGWGRKLLFGEYWPGSGTLHSVAQHPATGRILVHRGGKLWLSSGRDGTGWTEVTAIGPDGSLTATGAFTDGQAVVSGAAAAYLSNMVITGATPGQVFSVEMVDTSGPSVVISLYVNVTTLVARGTLGLGSQPASGFALVQQGGSGISAVVDVDGYGPGDECIGVATVAEYSVVFSLRGLTLENTDEYTLYWNYVVSGGTPTVRLYKDSAKTIEVASGEPQTTAVPFPVIGTQSIVGTGTASSVPSSPDGTYAGTNLEFSFSASSIDEQSTIAAYKEYGFVVFVRGAAPHNILVDSRIEKYMFLSLASGYGQSTGIESGFGAYQYRYLYTFSRIVDPETGEPYLDPSGKNRDNASLMLEGPSNLSGSLSETDYFVVDNADPVSGTDPNTVPLLDALPAPLGTTAAAYITHISIYRTMDVGVNGIGPNGAANNSELYGWIADVPIYSTSYEDTTDDTLLRNRLLGASTEQDSLALRSRLFSEMAKGIGAIGPDFMVTAEPLGQTATYCDLAANGRFIGYHYPASQRWLLNDPICEIYRTKDLFVYICPSSTYTSISAIIAEGGIPGLIPVVNMQNFDPASKTLGIKYGQGVFQVDESSFVTLLSDGTVRVFSASSWGAPLDAENVNGMTTQALPGAVFSFQRGTLLMWMRMGDPESPELICLRYGTGGPNGSKWTMVERANWAFPPSWCGTLIVEDDDAALRVAVFDEDTEAVFAVEDQLPLRQYVDDLVGPVGYGEPTGPGAEFVSNLSVIGTTATLYCQIFNHGSGFHSIIGYLTELDRTNETNAVFSGVQFSNADLPISGYELAEENSSGISGTVDVAEGAADGGTLNFDVVYSNQVEVIGTSEISSTILLRELTGAQENFTCFHQESHVAVRPRYGEASLPSGLLFTVRGYESGVLNNGATTVAAPTDFDIQFFARLQAKQIQVEYESNKSGWRITSFDTQYQSQDMQSGSGPWNSTEAQYQEALAANLVSWLYGNTGLIDRASPTGASYTGTAPTAIEGPSGTSYGQRFNTPVSRAYTTSLTDYTLMFWTLAPTIGVAPATGSVSYLTAALFAMFDTMTNLFASGANAAVSPAVTLGNGWQHFAITRTGTTLRIYQNGELILTTTVSGAAVPVTGQTVGCAEGRQDIDDLRLYSAALDAEVIAYYYNDVDLNQGKKVLP